jgi:hypothetical protein
MASLQSEEDRQQVPEIVRLPGQALSPSCACKDRGQRIPKSRVEIQNTEMPSAPRHLTQSALVISMTPVLVE